MTVSVISIKNPFVPFENSKDLIQYKQGEYLDHYLSNIDFSNEDISFIVSLNGKSVNVCDISKIQIKDKDLISVCAKVEASGIAAWITGYVSLSAAYTAGIGYAIAYGAVYLAATFVISYGLSVLAGALAPDVSTQKATGSDAALEQVYGWGELKQTTGEGGGIPLLFGVNKIPGQEINKFITINGNKEILNTLLAICDHQIDSISDVRINNQPYTYFKNVTVITDRLGTNNDTVIPGFDEIVTQVDIGSKLNQSSATVQQTGGTAVEKLIISISAPNGLYYQNDEGGLDSRSAIYTVHYRAVGAGSWILDATYTLAAATTSTKRQQITIDSLTPDQYEVQITRTNAAEDSSRGRSDIYFSSLQEIIKESLIYPGLAKYAIQVLATDQLSGSSPTFTCIATRSTVQVFDESLTTPVWVSKRATNPAWIVYSLLTEYAKIDTTKIVWDDFEKWADYCDEDIDGDYRFEINVIIYNGNFQSEIQRIAKIGRASIIRRGTRYGVFIDMYEGTTPQVSEVFSMGNIVEGTFKIQWLPKKDRANAVDVEYTDINRDHTRQVISVFSNEYLEENINGQRATVSIGASISEDEAIREGVFRINNNKYMDQVITFDAFIHSFASTTGDLAYFQHVIPDYTAGLGGRIKSAGNDDGSGNPYVELDQSFDLQSGTSYAVRVILRTGDIIEKLVNNSPGVTDFLTLTTSWVDVPVVSESEKPVFIFGDVTTYEEIIKITDISRRDDFIRTISAVPYVPGIYTENDGYVIETPTWLPQKSVAVNVLLSEFLTYGQDGSYISNINASWTRGYSHGGANWSIWLQDLTTPIIPEEDNLVLEADYRTFDTDNWVANAAVLPTVTKDQVGVDLIGNAASTITDSSSSYEALRYDTTIADDSNWKTMGIFVKKDTDETRFPGFGFYLIDGTNISAFIIFNTSDGTYDDFTPGGIIAITEVTNDWWFITISLQNNSTGNVTIRGVIYPAAADGTDITTADPTATGSIIIDYIQFCDGQTCDYTYGDAQEPFKVGTSFENSFTIMSGLILNKTYQVYISSFYEGATDTGNNTETILIQGKLAPPANVTNFAAIWDSIRRQVHFTWNANNEIDLKGYEIRSGGAWIGGTVVAEVGTNFTSIFIAEGVSESIVYRIKAIDTSGIYSVTEDTDTAAIDTTDCPLAVPTGLTWISTSNITSDGRDVVTLLATWTDSSGDSDDWQQYDIILEDMVVNKESFYITQNNEYQWEVMPNRSYGVIIRNTDKSGNHTSWTTQVVDTTTKDASAPATPTWPTSDYIIAGFKVIGLNWNTNSEYDMSHYVVERSTVIDFSSAVTILGDVSATFKSDDQGLDVSTQYYYRIKAVDTSGNDSGYSTIVGAITLQVGQTDIAANAIIASKINVTNLEAISANMGTLTAGVIESPNYVATGETSPEGFKIDATNDTFDMAGFQYDPTNGLQITDPNENASITVGDIIDGDYCILSGGDISFYRYLASAHRFAKSLKRIEKGSATNGVVTTLDGYWDGEPDIVVIPKDIRTYDESDSAQDQSLVVDAADIEETGAGTAIWRFTPNVILKRSSNIINYTPNDGANDTSGTGVSSVTCQTIIRAITNSGVKKVTATLQAGGSWVDQIVGPSSGNYTWQWRYCRVQVRLEYLEAGESWVQMSYEAYKNNIYKYDGGWSTWTVSTPTTINDITDIRMTAYAHTHATTEYLQVNPSSGVEENYWVRARLASFDEIISETSPLAEGTINYIAIGS